MLLLRKHLSPVAVSVAVASLIAHREFVYTLA